MSDRSSTKPVQVADEGPLLPPRLRLVVRTIALVVTVFVVSYPASSITAAMLAKPIVVVFLVWQVVRFEVRRHRDPASATPRSLLVPGVWLGLFVLLIAHVPLRVRFELSRGAFDEVIESQPSAGTFERWAPFDIDGVVGLYDVQSASRIGEITVIDSHVGTFFSNAGFVHFPDGIDPRLASGSFEAPIYVDLGGGWYAWEASF